jgi:hypothetical protein
VPDTSQDPQVLAFREHFNLVSRDLHFASSIMSASTGIVGAFPPPDGITPNFVNPDYIGYRIVVVALVFTTLAFTFLSVRLYTKRFVIRRLELDDCE